LRLESSTTNTARGAAGRKNNAMVTGDSVENFFLGIGGQVAGIFITFWPNITHQRDKSPSEMLFWLRPFSTQAPSTALGHAICSTAFLHPQARKKIAQKCRTLIG